MREENDMSKKDPGDVREPGLGKWSFSNNGYSHFLEISINHFKMAAARCVEKGLNFEHKVFTKRVRDLEEELRLLQKELVVKPPRAEPPQKEKRSRR
jgi:hypothetical protein